MLYRYILEIVGDKNAKIYSYKEKFRQCHKSLDTDVFLRKWNITYHLLDDMRRVEKPQYTRLIRAASTWGKPDYSVYEFNVTPIKHNKELVRLILAVAAIWGDYVNVRERRVDVTDAIVEAFEKSADGNRGIAIFDKFLKDDKQEKYIYVHNGYKEMINEYGSSNMAMEVYYIDVLVY